MQEHSRYVVGIDIGTKTVRCVVGHVGTDALEPKIIGVGVADNSGMRKGTITNLAGPASAIDRALEVAERMSGYQVNEAVFSINGAHILSTKADGMIAVGTANSEVTEDDIVRLEEVATTGKVPANREILEIVPHAYRLDGQDNIKDPLGMVGTRLEIRANIVSALAPYVANLQKTAEMAHVHISHLTPSVLAAARAVLTESQLENGVAVLDIGAATTGVAVFEDGDLQHVAVVPIGGQHVTNDIAIGLKIDPAVAETVKLAHANLAEAKTGMAEVKIDKTLFKFAHSEIHEIVEARYEEIFEAVQKELKRAGRAGKLPAGVVLVGGGAKTKGLAEFAKEQLGLSACLGDPVGFAGVSEEVQGPEFTAAIGLMLVGTLGGGSQATASHGPTLVKTSQAVKKAGGLLGRLFAKFK